jgi:EAL domain-containing protein (putative c-di-GMP-specific phosphodiesterase class I)
MSLELHVNLSAVQLGAERLLGDLKESLNTSRLDPALLVLEVAESTVVHDAVDVMERLNEFKSLGVSVAMDSFGAAYGALSQLKHLPLDILEFDRSLVADLGTDDSVRALLRTLVQIADNLGLQTLAIGVETEVQLSELRKVGCSGALGHLYSEPVDAKAFDAIFKEFAASDPTAWSHAPGAALDKDEVVDADEVEDEP